MTISKEYDRDVTTLQDATAPLHLFSSLLNEATSVLDIWGIFFRLSERLSSFQETSA